MVPIVAVDNSSVSFSTWDRFSRWASENKALVYTVGAVLVVATGAGIFYSINREPSQPGHGANAGEKKKSKKDRRKAKKDSLEGNATTSTRSTDATGNPCIRG